MKEKKLLKPLYAALCLALALVLPFFTGQIPQIGKMLCPMHIAVFLCAYLCDASYGAAVGFLAPLVRSLWLNMPAMYPDAAGMALEMAAYGLICGILYRVLPRKISNIYISLVAAMVGGRIVWGIARFLFATAGNTAFPFSAFMTGAFFNAVPGIILHIVLIPPIVIALEKAKIIEQ